jgi:hypothetical protein
MSRVRLALAVATAAAGVTLAGLAVQGQPTAKPAAKAEASNADDAEDHEGSESDKWMRIKLKASQGIFDGLTRGDHQKIEDNARRMLLLNFLEQWRRDNDFTRESEYEAQLNAFEYANKELIRTAHHKDIDGALDAYVRLSQSCVRCHQIIRDVPAKP